MTLETWERRFDWPLTALAMVFLAVYAWPILDPDMSHGFRVVLGVTNLAIWALFIIDYAVRVRLAPDHLRYAARNWLDLLMLVLPFLRPLRVLRAVFAVTRLGRQVSMSFRNRAVMIVSCAVPLIVFVAALAVLEAERNAPGANITSFGGALWWACTTVSTVGYGDVYPITVEGRLVAVALMVGGIALVGVVTAALASWFVERLSDIEDESQSKEHRELAGLVAEVRALRAHLESRP